MHCLSLLVLAAVAAMASAAGQFYVPRAYYVIDALGHESEPVPLRRLRRSLVPYPVQSYPGGSSATANANAESWGGSANANANAQAHSGGNGGWGVPGAIYGSAPYGLSSGESRRQFGPAYGRSVTATTSVGVDASGSGYYDQIASVSK
ncbi:uncharacterized protein LOC121730306 [Aricia agestis]|uniref:uncharacterized protein LOC121730306 n=1 Tax=Aricia agestis TaxID=91739 RepID=UPI001C202E43|nr:uncharacterized protein LOC121730306 [Aricia agestis]